MNCKLIITTFVFFLYTNFASSQGVWTYRKIHKAGKDKFNYLKKVKTKNNRSVKLVFSDRDDNTFYKSPYVQTRSKKKGLLTPLYVIGEKEDSYEVVLANPEQLGKPKGILTMLFSGKYSFKDAKSVEYLGWIPRKNVLNYDHSFLEPTNNKPLKYKLGTSKVKRLFDLKPFMQVDSVVIFKDPFLKVKSDKKLLSNQIVYPYKYDQSGKAVLIADKPVLKDSTAQIAGWVRSDLITLVGQNKSYLIDKKHQFSIFNTKKDTLSVVPDDIFSKYLYSGRKNSKKRDLKNLVVPLHVWNHKKNKLINVKGETFYTREIQVIKEESKMVNVHFVSNNDNIKALKTILNSLQNLYISLSEKTGEAQYNFSAVLIDKYGKPSVFKSSTSFAKWIDFIETFIDVNQNNLVDKYDGEVMTISGAINYTLDNFLDSEKRFENNLFIISSSKEKEQDLAQQKDVFFEKLAKKSPKVLFVQLHNEMDLRYQNYILGSKEFLYKTGKYYNEFMKNFIIDNEILIADNSLKNIASDVDNIYLYDAPNNSLFNGGIVFPKIGKSLTPLSLEIAIDSVLQRSTLTNAKLINSLVRFDKKLGVLRSKPNLLLDKIYHKRKSDTLNVNDFTRNNLHEVLYQKVTLKNDSIVPKAGYMFEKEELVDLIDDYRNTFPLMTKPINRIKRRIIKKLSLKQVRMLNKSASRRVLNRKVTFADLFYFKTGIPLNHKGYSCLRITKLPRKITEQSGFEKFYIKQYKKINKLEELYLKNKLQKVENGFNKEMYFIPIELLP